MAESQRAEPLGERYLRGVVKVLVTQEDDLVIEQRLADLGDGLVTQRRPVSTPESSAPIAPASCLMPMRAEVAMVSVTMISSQLRGDGRA